MNVKTCKAAILTTVLASVSIGAYAVPAFPGVIKYPCPNGDSINVILRGDERSHFFTSVDGYMLLRGDDDIFRYAVPSSDKLWTSDIIAADPGKRSVEAEALLSSISKQKPFSILEQSTKKSGSKYVNQVAPEAGESTFPTKGSPHVCIILVEFADNSFSVANPSQAFNDMFNLEGYNYNGASGSVADFFRASSNGQFTPTLDVLGPVKLPKNMSYYGGNDYRGNDLHPEEMVIDACTLLDPTVDFSLYDTDNDGVIDNVYVVYAGYGEAQGAPSYTIWPHSWDVYKGAGKTKYFDGKRLGHYATSNELKGTSGTTIDGIGTFCHEFSHVMGLPDLYATSYTGAFTPGNYSLMDHGSYNNSSRTPPTHSGYERYCLGWIEPKVLDAPETVSIKPISEPGCYDDVRIIKTPKNNEYFILENRQNKSWDTYIPGHGMLIWHIDYNPTVWASNKCNNTVGRQYIDIEEADNIQSESTRAGDTFPGTKNVTSFTDDTQPSMLTWDGTRLEAPITGIQEQDGIITFLFKGGTDIFDPVTATEPADDGESISPSSFIARWNKVDKATGYLLNVYTKSTERSSGATHTYLPGFNKKEVGDVDHFQIDGLIPATTYYFTVQATNGVNISAQSNEVAVTTLDPTLEYKQVEALDATEIKSDGFTANWLALDDADGYLVTLYSLQLGAPELAIADFANGTLPAGWTSYGTASETNDASYAVQLPSRRFKTDQSYIQTAEFKDGIRTLSFWYRPSVENQDNKISVKGKVNGNWDELDILQPLPANENGTHYSLEKIPANCTQLNISFTRGLGDVAMDDITVGHGGPMTWLPIEGQQDIDAGNNTSYPFDSLSSDSRFGFAVQAYNETMKSLMSNIVTVMTSSPSGINNASIATQPLTISSSDHQIKINLDYPALVNISDITGRILQSCQVNGGEWSSRTLPSGIYIVSVNSTNIIKITVH